MSINNLRRSLPIVKNNVTTLSTSRLHAAVCQRALSRLICHVASSEPQEQKLKNLDDTVQEPSLRKEAQLSQQQYQEIYDRLIKLFQDRPREDWKKLIVFSRQWKDHSTGIFNRIKQLSDEESNVDKKLALRKLFRSLQKTHEEVQRYNSVLEKFLQAQEDEWQAIVVTYRGDLQKGFFEHMQCLIAAAKHASDSPTGSVDALVMMNARLVALCSAHDSIEAQPEKLAAAAGLYKDLLSSISSIDDIDKKMGKLASEGRIDPAFLQISARAYGAARDTEMTRDEAKWVSYKMFRSAKDYFDRQQPAEQRIIEYLLTVNDPSERSRLLDEAVTPGPTRYTDTHDIMWSTPQRLYTVLHATVDAFEAMRAQAGKKLGASEESVTPRNVKVMRELRDEIVRRYL